jgi:hypothetical protein
LRGLGASGIVDRQRYEHTDDALRHRGIRMARKFEALVSTVGVKPH